MKLGTITLTTFLWLATPTSVFAQTAPTKLPTKYALCRDLMTAERLLRLSFEFRNTIESSVILANAASMTADIAVRRIYLLKPQLEKKLSAKEIQDLIEIRESIIKNAALDEVISQDSHRGRRWCCCICSLKAKWKT